MKFWKDLAPRTKQVALIVAGACIIALIVTGQFIDFVEIFK